METKNIFSESGIIITMLLIAIPIIAASILVMIKAKAVLKKYLKKKELEKFNEYLKGLSPDEIEKLEQRKREHEFSLSNLELSGDKEPIDCKGLIDNISEVETLRFVEQKKKSQPRPYIEPDLSKLILWYLGCATFWLLFGTTVGEYLGIKFVAPDVDQYSWLSFGRLRPVHTNAVFWGWASLAMMGLAYYVIPRVSNVPIASIKTGYRSLVLINVSVILGSIFLMAGINNGGGEYREYIWPVMALFGIGIIISLQNFFKTIAKRTTKEIYVSNWYIISAMMFLLVIAIIAYWPSWQNGLGETIIQGYYMHQGVGMWFMLFNLGLMYYFLPQQLNKPIYSYSLGILAFWAQILFYTLIGTHHFIFSAIPWWLQTVAIIGSAGMIIPVVAGTTNFLLTFKGSWNKLSGSYTLPFYLIGILFYFTGSLQGTAEAFRFTNLVWHFTDFTVAHSHLTMYGIICFMLWGFIYTVVPRITGKEPPQITVGAHFWLALIGLLFYTFPLMYGSTLRGLMWMEGTKSFIESVELMAPYWLWRAIGGSLMWFSHVLFAYNFYVMVRKKDEIEIPKSPIDILRAKQEVDKQTITN
ncbi:MAG: cbb3-type cytochrome c oxidase subunit I [Chitinophagaceae bacterium]|jgi:cytochrome c oxidase cbb3-type subunit 1|nr:cbb3-type cytochrome c oxidase subunit I [Bacteroidota bacterium]MBK8365478.1 cbb3-type cytochrome c oxidase subunit I [Bacteroidota bacterium]MBK9414482.1 cbb3-type cytochrome c oxidase subunit I [Bacteroidota bacterium]MBP6476734.1 cbb3-type cytochrome c oxidase subunit I [Chitinophagaceae bacterium]MBP7256732.1 cbb3-type cytochrome c oxidase subunit I [Chitinophagales bacterium]